jgi:hypothetical protein
MKKFQQNGLLDNVTLWFDKLPSNNIVQPPVLCHLIPLLNDLLSVELKNSAQLAAIYDAENSKEIHGLYMKMMEQTRFLGAR